MSTPTHGGGGAERAYARRLAQSVWARSFYANARSAPFDSRQVRRRAELKAAKASAATARRGAARNALVAHRSLAQGGK